MKHDSPAFLNTNSEPATTAQHPYTAAYYNRHTILHNSFRNGKSLEDTRQIYSAPLKPSDHGVGGGSHTHIASLLQETHTHIQFLVVSIG